MEEMVPGLEFLSRLVVRTPFYGPDEYARRSLQDFLADDDFRRALFLATPDFFRVLEAAGFSAAALGGRERLTLWKYVNRMCFRPTPFGACASVGLACWGGEDGPEMSPEFSLSVLPDQEIALQLASRLLAGSWREQRWHLNPTLYVSGRQYRFMSRHGERSLRFRLESLERNSLTRRLFRWVFRENPDGERLVKWIGEFTGCDAAEALDYFGFLRDSGLIFSNSMPNMVGADYLSRVLTDDRLTGGSPDELLSLSRGMSALPGKETPVGLLAVLSSALAEGLGMKSAAKSCFYTVMRRDAASGGLPASLQGRLRTALGCLRKIAVPGQLSALSDFTEKFSARFERRKMPLLLALDPEMGIDYAGLARHAAYHQLLEEIGFGYGETARQTAWSEVHQLLLDRWQQAGHTGGPLVLERGDIDRLAEPELPLPPGISVLFRQAGAELLIESAGGVTGLALTGRFGKVHEGICDLNRELAGLEQEHNPDVLFCELGQLSDDHADNINRREHYYDYEIPLNAGSVLPPERQVALWDLEVSVAGGRIVLESRSRGKQVVPRLSSAYNYQRNSLPVFRFLADLQYQGVQGQLSFSLDHYFPGLSHYPRVMVDGTVLSPEKWLVSAVYLSALKAAGPSGQAAVLAELRSELSLPRRVALTSHDQQLVFDLDNPEERGYLAGLLVAGEAPVVLQEVFIPVPAGDTVQAPARVCQYVALLVNKQPVYQGPVDLGGAARKASDFALGSRWLYLKIFCVPSASNRLLGSVIAPLIFLLLREGKVLRWFFVRYNVPQYHLRLRLFLPEGDLGGVLSLFENKLAGYINTHLIHDYQADTYRPEIERYGEDLMELCEEIFCSSSRLVLQFIRRSRKEGFAYPYYSLALLGTRSMLEWFLPGLDEQVAFLKKMSDSFYREFSADKQLRVSLDSKYRSMRREVEALLADGSFYAVLKLRTEQEELRKLMVLLGRLTGRDAGRRLQLLADMIHMHLNRLFVLEPRKQELIVYYLLYKAKLSERARIG